MSISEFDIIRRYFQSHDQQYRSKQCLTDNNTHTGIAHGITHGITHIGIGDDCAVISIPPGKQLAMSMDTLLAGRHFLENTPPEHIATRAFCVCLSDLAAMGATPEWFTLGLTMPKAESDWLHAFSESLFGIAKQYQCELVGGDTTQGSLALTLQVHGTVAENTALKRSAAKAGDLVYVTGCLGDGAAALQMLTEQAQFSTADMQYLAERFYCPEPQIKAGQLLCPLAHAAIDISDGLLADLGHIAMASEVDIVINVDRVPLSDACRSVDLPIALDWAVAGGDDYQLAFTVPPHNTAHIEALIASGQLQATSIGSVKACVESEPSVRCQFDNKPWLSQYNKKGFQHFAS